MDLNSFHCFCIDMSCYMTAFINYKTAVITSYSIHYTKLYDSETKNQEFIDFCKATGLRKEELECLRGTQLVCKNGIYYIGVSRGAKGGRYRESPIISNVDAIVERMKKAGTGKVWVQVPDIDVHSYSYNFV